MKTVLHTLGSQLARLDYAAYAFFGRPLDGYRARRAARRANRSASRSRSFDDTLPTLVLVAAGLCVAAILGAVGFPF